LIDEAFSKPPKLVGGAVGSLQGGGAMVALIQEVT